MRRFEEILDIAAERKGGREAVLGDSSPPLSADALAAIRMTAGWHRWRGACSRPGFPGR